MVIIWLVLVGIACLGLAGYCGLKYGTVPSKFDYDRYDKWFKKIRPHLAREEYDRIRSEHPNSAPTDFPLQQRYLNEVNWGKKSIVIFATSGGILSAIGSIL